jgi:hypothetical protein
MSARIDTSPIKSPRDPMTPEEREAVRQESREGLALVARYVEEHGDPWAGLRPDWAKFGDDALDDHAA